jgi:hypothetical protein
MDSVHGLWTAASVGPSQTKDSCSAVQPVRLAGACREGSGRRRRRWFLLWAAWVGRRRMWPGDEVGRWRWLELGAPVLRGADAHREVSGRRITAVRCSSTVEGGGAVAKMIGRRRVVAGDDGSSTV